MIDNDDSNNGNNQDYYNHSDATAGNANCLHDKYDMMADQSQ